jgi:hypothetical protein
MNKLLWTRHAESGARRVSERTLTAREVPGSSSNLYSISGSSVHCLLSTGAPSDAIRGGFYRNRHRKHTTLRRMHKGVLFHSKQRFKSRKVEFKCHADLRPELRDTAFSSGYPCRQVMAANCNGLVSHLLSHKHETILHFLWGDPYSPRPTSLKQKLEVGYFQDPTAAVEQYCNRHQRKKDGTCGYLSIPFAFRSNTQILTDYSLYYGRATLNIAHRPITFPLLRLPRVSAPRMDSSSEHSEKRPHAGTVAVKASDVDVAAQLAGSNVKLEPEAAAKLRVARVAVVG